MRTGASGDALASAAPSRGEDDPLGSSVTAPDGRFLQVNRTLCVILDRPAAKLHTMTYAAVVHPDDYVRELEPLAELLAGKSSSYAVEERYVRPDGEIRWVAVCASLVGEDHRCVLRRTFDVTERRRAEGQRDRIFDYAPDLITIGGLDGSVHRVNPAHTKVLGWSGGELSGRGWEAVVHPEDQGEITAQMMKLAAGQEVVDFEVRARCRDGRYRWLSTRVVADVGDGAVYAYSRDVTERKLAEETLARREEQSQRLFDESPIGMAVTDRDLRFVRVNSAFSSMLGYCEEELVGRSYVEVTHPDDVDVDSRLARQLLAGERAGYDVEKRYIGHDGEVVWGRIRATAIDFGPSDLRHHLAIVEDISEVRRAEALRREYEDLKDAFLRVTAHDLQGPLVAISGLAEVLVSPPSGLDTVAQREILHRIASQARRLQHLVDTFLDLDRLYHNAEHAHRRPTDLSALTRQVVDTVDLGDRAVVIEAETPVVAVDPDQVERILENLVTNVVVHTPPGTPIWVRVTGADVVSMVVEDAGPGVPDHLKDVVFELFRTVDKARRGGTGLWLVKRLAELHGGHAWVQDRPGGGASFRVMLPTSGTDEGGAS